MRHPSYVRRKLLRLWLPAFLNFPTEINILVWHRGISKFYTKIPHFKTTWRTLISVDIFILNCYFSNVGCSQNAQCYQLRFYHGGLSWSRQKKYGLLFWYCYPIQECKTGNEMYRICNMRTKKTFWRKRYCEEQKEITAWIKQLMGIEQFYLPGYSAV